MPNSPRSPLTRLSDAQLQRALLKDRKYLEKTAIPIVTVSATFKEDLKGLHHLQELDTIPDVVFSRAHYSMTLGIAIAAWGGAINPQKAWIVDPTNYVASEDWKSIKLTEVVGKTIARYPLLKSIKDLIDNFGRQKLPILDNIAAPIAYLTKQVRRPILSMHIASGNLLIEQGHQVVQAITDPQVREDYLKHADNPKISYCVFDQKTKTELLEKARTLGKVESTKDLENRVVVTGPPIDPRVVSARRFKYPWQQKRKLHLCLTTGGLGTNGDEIEQILHQVVADLAQPNSPFQLMVYAGTHEDIAQLVTTYALRYSVPLTTLAPTDPGAFEIGETLEKPRRYEVKTPLTLLYHPQIVDANELLISHAFPWADGFITKPSGDMAYDAVASGSFLLTLHEWGEWEHNVREVFEQKNISRRSDTEHICLQLRALMEKPKTGPAWITQAMENAHTIDDLFLHGADKILKTYRELTRD